MGVGRGVGVVGEPFTVSCQKCLYIFCCKLTLQLKTSNLPSFTVPLPPVAIFQEAFPAQSGCPGLGGHPEAVDAPPAAAWDRGEGCDSWESLANAPPRPGSPGLSPFQPTFLT